MTTTRIQRLTPIGVAWLIKRGVEANFAPENQAAKLSELAELFGDMAMSRAIDAQDGDMNSCKTAHHDARWLDDIADGLFDR